MPETVSQPNPVRFTVAGIVVGKGRPRFQRRGLGVHVHTPQKTIDYEDTVRGAAQSAMRDRPPIEGAVRCEVKVFVGVPASWSKKKRAACLAGQLRPVSKPDWDNYVKILDALNLVVWRDDSLVVDGTFGKWYSERPRLEVVVTAL